MLLNLLFLASTTLHKPSVKPLPISQPTTVLQRYEQKAQACMADLAKMTPMPSLMADGVPIEVDPDPKFNRRLAECGRVMEMLLILSPQPFKKK